MRKFDAAPGPRTPATWLDSDYWHDAYLAELKRCSDLQKDHERMQRLLAALISQQGGTSVVYHDYLNALPRTVWVHSQSDDNGDVRLAITPVPD